uniref:Uncharacterized protein n=1 Tax=Panagrolaimus sp. JU765 TaxID=591449 RepID=A0AC34RM38_9BILA
MKLFVFFVFLLIKADGKNDVLSQNDTNLPYDPEKSTENERFWDIKTTENPTTNQEDDQLSQNDTNSLYDVEKSSNQSFLLAPRPPKVEQDENGVTFNSDAKVNVTLTERKFQLTIYDPDVKKGDNQKITSFCFKAKCFVQPKENPQCLPNYCEIKVDYGVFSGAVSSNANFGDKGITIDDPTMKIEVTENKMYVIGQENEAVNSCEFDDEEGYLPVQLIYKGDRQIYMNGVKIYNDTSRVTISDSPIVYYSAGSCAGFLFIFSLILFIVYCSKKPRYNPVAKAEKEPKQKNDAKVVQKQVSTAQKNVNITNK